MEKKEVQIAYFLAEGHTLDEAAQEFRCRRETIERRLEIVKFHNSKLYERATSRYLRALGAIVELKIPVNEALKKFKVNKKDFNTFLEKDVKPSNKQLYVIATYRQFSAKTK